MLAARCFDPPNMLPDHARCKARENIDREMAGLSPSRSTIRLRGQPALYPTPYVRIFFQHAVRRFTMGLLDVLNGMQNGPHGPSHPSTKANGGMSPMTMAILALLAWKAVKHFGQSSEPNAAPGTAPRAPTQIPPSPVPANAGGGAGAGGPGGGGLGGLLTGGLGGLLGGAAAGSVLSGGLGDLLNQLQKGGQGDAANSWVGSGTNKPVAPGDLANALGADQIAHIASQSGMSREDLLNGLSQYLPQVVDHLTPEGRVPTDNELSGRI
jgi:uncharacterized protein YidB (DUF937 family)